IQSIIGKEMLRYAPPRALIDVCECPAKWRENCFVAVFLAILCRRQMFAGDVAKCECRTQICASTHILASHDMGHVGADCIKAVDRRTVGAQYASECVRLEPSERAEVAWVDLDGVERPVF